MGGEGRGSGVEGDESDQQTVISNQWSVIEDQ